MPVLNWDNPKQAMPVKAWRGISADGAPPGVYTPNMSDADMEKWKAKIVRPKTGPRRVEVRKTIRGTQLVVVVSQGGFPARRLVRGKEVLEHPDCVVRVSSNGPTFFTAVEWAEFEAAVGEAKAALAKEKK